MAGAELDMASIYAAVSKQLNTASGRKAISDAYKKAGVKVSAKTISVTPSADGLELAGSHGVSDKELERYRRKLEDIVLEHVPFDMQRPSGGLVYIKSVSEGDMPGAEFRFYKAPLRRKSLDPTYPKRVYDIFGLVEDGYDIDPMKKRVWGMWHGKRIHNAIHRDAEPFLAEAFEEFNTWVQAENPHSNISINYETY